LLLLLLLLLLVVLAEEDLLLFTGDVLRECTSCRLLAARLGDVYHSSLDTDVVGENSFALPFLVDDEVTDGEAGLFVDLLPLLFELLLIADELPLVEVLREESFWPSSCLAGGGLEASLDELEWEPPPE